jgi:hypothetical protein
LDGVTPVTVSSALRKARATSSGSHGVSLSGMSVAFTASTR